MTRFNDLYPALAAGLDWEIRATAVFVAAAAIVFLLRKSTAATRHVVWSAAMLCSLFLPLLQWSVPGWEFSLSSRPVEKSTHSDRNVWLAYHQESRLLDASIADFDPRHSIDAHQGLLVARSSLATDDAAALASPNIWNAVSRVSGVVMIAWGFGSLVMLAGLVIGVLSLRRVRYHSQPLPPHIESELKQLSRELGLVKPVAGVLSRERAIPMTWGILHPIVLLPEESTSWSPERRRMVILHELAHVRRCDFATQLLGQLARAVHWCNPIAWWAFSRMRLEQERACDDVVLNGGACPTEYASELVSILRQVPTFAWDGAVALAMSRFECIEKRLSAILDASRDRRPLSNRRTIALLVAMSLVISCVVIPRWSSAVADDQNATSPELIAQAKSATDAKAEDKSAPEKTAQTGESTLTKVEDLIRKNAAKEIDSKRLTEGAIKGMLESLHDPHSELLATEAFREIQTQLDGAFVGIGAQLALEKNTVVIVAPLPRSPAAKSGLKPGDEVLAVDGAKVGDLREAVSAIRGPQGSEVKLKIRRGGQELEVAVTRDVVPLATSKGISLDVMGNWQHWLDSEAKLAYVQITEFNRRTVDDAQAALKTLHDGGMKGLIVDLRGCPGGLLSESVKVAGLFLKAGTVATIRSRQQPEQKFDVDGTATQADVPLIVLVDDMTASAAEIVASALQDHQRAIVIGERTFGKGSVQTLIPVSDLDANLKITTAQIHRASGNMLQRSEKGSTWGVDPNEGYFIPLSSEQRATYRERRAQRDLAGKVTLSGPDIVASIKTQLADPVLAAAFQSLSAKIKTGDFEKTGRPLAEMQAQLTQRDALRLERDQLLQKLKQIEKQL